MAVADTVLITGCSSGIGRETALAFLDEGWTVYATARDPADIAGLADRGAETRPLDVTDPEECKAAIERVVEERDELDVLVNNAGYAQLGALEDVPPRRLRRQFEVNTFGPHRLARWALPHMREAGDGTIINVSSVVGRLATPGAGAYAGSKFALEAMSDALRAEVDSFGVDVVVVEPGPVTTAFDDRAEDELDDLDRTGAYDALYRLLEDKDVVSEALASNPREVAAVILQAGTSSNPEPRYSVGEIARLAAVGRHLPPKWRDAAYGLASKLAR